MINEVLLVKTVWGIPEQRSSFRLQKLDWN